MRERLLSSLAFAGLGITVSFLVVVAFFHPATSMKTLTPIYITGLFAGAVYGGVRKGANASGVAFVLGFVITVLLNYLWMYHPLTFSYSLAFLAVVIVGMFMVEGKSNLDIGLVPFSYFGGFILGMLIFMNSHLGEIEGAVMSVMVTGVVGAFVALFMSLLRALFGMFRGGGKGNL